MTSNSIKNDEFPSLIIGANGKLQPQGTFAEAQAEFLHPDPEIVSSLSQNLMKANMGIVAHYYMDVELQGVLTAIRKHQIENGSEAPRIAIADSLAMGDYAVKMAEAGATSIACLGVDFMSESVSAILSKNGFGHIPVYRATPKSIGCSLAESAERDVYRAWLTKAANAKSKALHVVYINTSLSTKAVSSSIIPTITCTSSNVLRTILQASVQVGPEDLQIYYGPDTYMGHNLVSMLDSILKSPDWTDEKIQKDLHPQHNQKTLESLKDRMDVFPNGNCVVHHMFGGDVVETVKKNYDDAFVTAHLEVPGEMFEIALEKSLKGNGVVGSTSDILRFISKKVDEAATNDQNGKMNRLKFILGTEAGMVTSIVKSVQDILAERGSEKVEAEIIFPVASDAITAVDDSDLSIVPGVKSGEGCSTAGGCATCPFMKMNDLDALSDVVNMVKEGGNELKLRAHLPPTRLEGQQINGVDATDLGIKPIMYMREFMQQGELSDELVKKIEDVANP